MEAVANILTSANGIPVLLFALIVLVVVIVAVKKGIISFSGRGLNIGDHISNSSRIKQLQWDYLQATTEIALRNLPKEYLEEPKKWRTHYTVGKYRDVLQQAIIANNIIKDDEYIESKQVLAYAAILKATQDDYFKSEEFKNLIDKETKEIILQFVRIKEKYE